MKNVQVVVSKFKLITLIILIFAFALVIGFVFINSNNGEAEESYPTNDGFASSTNKLHSIFHKDLKVALPLYNKDSRLVNLYTKKKYKQVISIGEEEASSDSGDFSTQYLVAMSYFKTNQYTKAAFHFSNLVKKDSPIKEWLYYHLAQSCYYMNSFNQSLDYLKLFKAQFPKSIYLNKTVEMEGKLLLHLKKPQILIDEFSPMLKTKDLKVLERLYYFIGKAYHKMKQKSEATIYYKKAIGLASLAYTKKTLLGLQSIDREYIDKLNSSQIIHTTNYIYKRKEKKSQKKRDFKTVASLLKSIGKQNNHYLEFKRLSLLAQSYEHLKKIKKANKVYKKMISSFQSPSKYAQEVQFRYAHFLKKKDKTEAYIALVDILETPKHRFMKSACRSFQSLVDYDDEEDVVLYVVKSISVREYRLADKVLFHLINKKRYNKLFKIFSKVLNNNIENKYKVKISYWLGKASDETGKKEEAIRYFVDGYLDYKRDYYTYKSLNQLKLLLRNEPKTLEAVYDKDRKNYNDFIHSPEFISRLKHIKLKYDFSRLNDPLFQEAFMLLSLGEVKVGYNVFLRYLKTINSRRLHLAQVISGMFYEMKLYQFSIRYSDFMIGYLNGTNGRNYISPELKRSSYPIYFKEAVFKMSKRYNVEPYLVLAIIREESRFFQSATSKSGARGLMQLMPATARYLLKAKKNEQVNFYDKRLNISLGTMYIARLLKKDSISIAVAGYNGGPGRVGRLFKKIKRRVDLLNDEHFVEIMDIDETRNYVKKVLTSYYNYKEIYH